MIALEIVGADALARRLASAAATLAKPLRPLLQALGLKWQAWFRNHIKDDGAGLDWPELHQGTRAIRKHYGHDSKARLLRRGDLLQSIDILGLSDDELRVGSNLHGGPGGTVPVARILQSGGEVTQDGHTRKVQAFPFIVLTETDLEITHELISEYFELPNAA